MHVYFYKSALTRKKKEPFLNRIIGDEKWIIYKNILHKRQWLDKEHLSIPDSKADIHGKKIIVCMVGFSKTNPSRVLKVKFKNYCEYILSAAAKNEREIP